MDAWSVAKRTAADLRAGILAVSRPGDASPLEAALTRADLEVCGFTPGLSGFAANLRARLEREALLIYVSDRLDPRERVHAIAHELGHFLLHADPILDDAVDAAPSGGLDGYSTRELKEVQADAFAAEFLCPVTMVRAALAGRRGLESIAEEFGVPARVALRQSVDALLQPPPATVDAEEGRRARRDTDAPIDDPDQAACVHWTSGALLVEGRSGTGKTTALLARVERLLGWVSPARILVVVGSDQAARAVRARLAGPPAAAGEGAGVQVGTFADLALEIVVKWPGRIDLDHRVRIVDRRPAAPGDGDREAAQDDVGGEVEAGALVETAIAILEADAGLLAKIRHRHAHVLVDDLQDATAAEADLLALLRPPGTDLVAAGDAGQAIAAHRGADGRALREFAARHGAAGIRLGIDHRSRGGVARLLSRLDGGSGPFAGAATLATAPTVADEAAAVRDRIEEARSAGIPYRDQVVLARTHLALERIVDGLAALGVPLSGLRDLHRRGDVRDLVAFVALVRDGDWWAFRRLAVHRSYGASTRDVEAVEALARRERLAPRAALARLGAIDRMSGAGRTGLARLRADLATFAPDAAPATIVAAWSFDLSGYLAPLLRADAGVGERVSLMALHEVLRICEEQRAQGAVGTADLVMRLASVGSSRTTVHGGRVDPAAVGLDAVSVMTIHASRGREFEAVHLVAASSGVFPPPRTDPEEEERVLRVALSRSRDRVHVSCSERLGPGQPRRGASPHLALLGDALTETPVAGKTPVRANTRGSVRRAPGGTHLEADLAAYMACPASYARRLGRDLGQPWRRNAPDGPGTTWRVRLGSGEVLVRVALDGEDRARTEPRIVEQPGTVDGRRRARALPALLALGAAQARPGTIVRATPAPGSRRGADPASEAGAYVTAMAGIAAGAFAPRPEGIRTCVACPYYVVCDH